MLFGRGEDLNLRPLRPERSALPGLRYAPTGQIRKTKPDCLTAEGKTQTVRFSHCLARNLPIHDVHPLARPDRRMNGFPTPSDARTDKIGKVVGQRSRGGVWHKCGHVGHAIMHHPSTVYTGSMRHVGLVVSQHPP